MYKYFITIIINYMYYKILFMKIESENVLNTNNAKMIGHD